MKSLPPPNVTPIFPRNNGYNEHNISSNLPIRKLESSKNVLNSGGFNLYPHPYHIHQQSYQNQPHIHHQPPSDSLNCVTIAQHIETCPICSRIYDTDKTLYILAIIGLLILCFLMVKHIVKI